MTNEWLNTKTHTFIRIYRTWFDPHQHLNPCNIIHHMLSRVYIRIWFNQKRYRWWNRPNSSNQPITLIILYLKAWETNNIFRVRRIWDRIKWISCDKMDKSCYDRGCGSLLYELPWASFTSDFVILMLTMPPTHLLNLHVQCT